MAYTIISQNNSTTTLSDGVNTITVPSRVNLTSGNFTIVEVNNNMATLEDGDGNVYRDIPCVATLAGEGGGGSSLPDQTGHSGEFLTTDGTDASWAAVDALPDQTGNSGKFLTTDGTSPSWSDKPLVNKATGTNSFVIGNSNESGKNYSTSVGNYATAYDYATSLGSGAWAQPRSLAIGASSGGLSYVYDYIAIGYYAQCYANYAIQLGRGTNSETGTFCVGSYYNNTNVNYKLLDADGTIPTDRLTKVNSTITLTAAGWSSNTQTVTVTGMTATGVVLVSPDPTDQADYTSAGIICTAQATDSLTFTATSTPSADIDVNVVML